MTVGIRIAAMVAAASSNAGLKPSVPTRSNSVGATTMPPQVAPFICEAEGEPVAPLEPDADDVRDHHRAHSGPAERHQRIGHVELPWRRREGQQHQRGRKRGNAREQHSARSNPFHHVARVHHQEIAEQQ